MLAVWGNILTLFNVITAMVGSVLIYDSFFTGGTAGPGSGASCCCGICWCRLPCSTS